MAGRHSIRFACPECDQGNALSFSAFPAVPGGLNALLHWRPPAISNHDRRQSITDRVSNKKTIPFLVGNWWGLGRKRRVKISHAKILLSKAQPFPGRLDRALTWAAHRGLCLPPAGAGYRMDCCPPRCVRLLLADDLFWPHGISNFTHHIGDQIC